MIKFPEPGKVKTRLAEDVGHEKAATIYRQVVEQILIQTNLTSHSRPPVDCPTLKKGGWGDLNENAQSREISPNPSLSKRGISENGLGGKSTSFAYERIVFFDPPDRLKDFQSWLQGEQFISQQGKDVGERMDIAIRALLDSGAEKAVLTGADIPDLNSAVIAQAFAALDDAEIILGPAEDGGYYLIGMKSPHPEIFHEIPWSTPRVFEETVSILDHLRLHYRCVEMLSDLDTPDDYNRFIIRNARLRPGTSS